MKSHASLSILMAGLLAAAGAYAQSNPPTVSSDLPPKTADTATQTQGMPTPAPTSSATTAAPAASSTTEAPMANKDASKEAQNMGAAASTSSAAPKSGEASTVVQGKPNIDPTKPHAMSRDEVRAELMGRRAAFEAERKAMLKQG